MRKNYLFTVACTLLFASMMQLNAQAFPWPDLGDYKMIDPGPPGTINNTIMGDTSDTGERLHNHYLLRRNATYIYTARIENDGWPLMVQAEPGDGEVPIIRPLGPAEGQDEAERPFHAPGNLYLKNLTLVGWDMGGNYTDNATVRLAASDITVVLKNINFDFNRQNAIRINSTGCKLYVEDCIFGNQGVSQRFQQGFAIAFRGNFTPVVHLKDNIFYNNHSEIIQNLNTARYGKLIMENNTIVNTGQGGSYFGRPDTLIVRNNLWVNIGIMGDGILGDRDKFVEPYYFLVLDSTFTSGADPVLTDPLLVDFDYNHFYLDPAVAASLPDSSNKSTDSFFHPYLADLMGAHNVVKDEAFSFTDFPATTQEYENYINDYYIFADEPAQMPQFDTDFREFDFSYSNSHEAYSAASDGGPLGDRRNFPDWVGTAQFVNQIFDIFPNPADDHIRIRLNENQTVDNVLLLNMLGQEIMSLETNSAKEFSINTKALNSGVYLVRFYHNNRLQGTSKLLKK